MTIKSLQDLNTYALTPITYNDVRTAQVLFDRGATVNQTLTTSENAEFTLPWGINIEDITQFDVAQVEYHIDLTAWTDPVTVTWDYLPDHVTVTRGTGNDWIVSDIRSASDWLFVREARVLPPFGFSGLIQHRAEIQYYSDNQDSTKNIAGWDIDITFTQIEYFAPAADRTYTSNTLYENFNPTSIIADPEDFDPVWDLRIFSSEPGSVAEMYSDGSPGEATWNAASEIFTITGDTGSVNEVLSTFDLETARFDADFTLYFRLANNFTNDLEIQVQQFFSRDFISDQTVVSGQTCDNNYIRGFIANPFAVFANSSTVPSITRRPNATSLDSVAGINSAPIKIPGDHMSTPGASTIRTNQTVEIQNNPILQHTYPAGIAPNFTVIITATGTQPTEIFTAGSGGTVTWNDSNPSAVFLTIVGTQEEVNSHLNSMTIEFDTTLSADVQLRYQTAWDFVNPVVDNVYQTLEYLLDISNLDVERSYRSGKKNILFTSDLPVPDNPDYTNFSVTLSVVDGDFLYDGTFSNSVTVTGTTSTLGALLETVEYYPDFGQTGDETVTYSIQKDSIQGSSGTFNLDYLGAGSFTSTTYTFNSPGTTTWTPTKEEQLYGQMDYAVIGGGGGGSYVGQLRAYDRYITNTFGSGASRSTVEKKFGSHSAYFDGTSGAYIDGGTGYVSQFGEIIIDFWMRPDNITQIATLFDSGDTNSIRVRQNLDEIEVYMNNAVRLSGGSLSANTWHHIHIEEYYNDTLGALKMALYIDGSRVDVTATRNRSAGTAYRIGNNASGTEPYSGYIDEFFNGGGTFSPIVLGDPGTPADPWIGKVKFNYDTTETLNFTPSTLPWKFDFVDVYYAVTVNDIDDNNLYSGGDFTQLLHFDDVYPSSALISDNNFGYYNGFMNSQGGGGGAVNTANAVISNSSYSVVVGAGGAGGNINYSNQNYQIHGDAGENSSFNGTTSLGGEGGTCIFDYDNDPYYRQNSTYLNTFTTGGITYTVGGGVGGTSGNGNAGGDSGIDGSTLGSAFDQVGPGGGGTSSAATDGSAEVSTMVTLNSTNYWNLLTPGDGTDVTLNDITLENLGQGGWGATGQLSKDLLDDAGLNPPTLFNPIYNVSIGRGGYGYNNWYPNEVDGKAGAVVIRTRNR